MIIVAVQRGLVMERFCYAALGFLVSIIYYMNFIELFKNSPRLSEGGFWKESKEANQPVWGGTCGYVSLWKPVPFGYAPMWVCKQQGIVLLK